MPPKAKIGYLDANGHPYIKIRVWGWAERFAQDFEAMIDTGFTGFMSIPLTAAFPLALSLFGTATYTLADGSASAKLLGFGTVAVEDESAHGTMVLEPNATGILLGMEFLRKLKKALVVSKDGVWLLHDEIVPSAPQVVVKPAEDAKPEEGPEK